MKIFKKIMIFVVIFFLARLLTGVWVSSSIPVFPKELATWIQLDSGLAQGYDDYMFLVALAAFVMSFMALSIVAYIVIKISNKKTA